MNYKETMKKLWPDGTQDAMAGMMFILITWTSAASVTDSDGQCNSTTPAKLVAEHDKILSLDFQFIPSNTTRNTACQWIISSSDGSRLRLTAAIFDLRSENGSCVDNFTVYDGNTSHSPLLLSTCWGLGSPIYSTGSDVFISFNPGKTHTNTKPRFAISYEPFGPSKFEIVAHGNTALKVKAQNGDQAHRLLSVKIPRFSVTHVIHTTHSSSLALHQHSCCIDPFIWS